MSKKVVSIHCADMHFRHTPPVARSVEADWYEAMGRYVSQLKELQQDHGNVPIFCSGDVFDKPDSRPELINWCIRNLPKMYSIPGQHDLPQHSYELKHKSAYETLVLAGVIVNIDDNRKAAHSELAVYGFGWNEEVTPPDEGDDGVLKVAIIHDYIWTKYHKYRVAPKEAEIAGWARKLKGYDAAFFGDNHKGFVAKVGSCNVMNCGCFFPGNVDEIDYKPTVGLLFDDGSIERYFLDTLQDEWLTDDKVVVEGDDTRFAKLLEEIASVVRSTDVNFRQVVDRAMKSKACGLSKLGKRVVLSIMEATDEQD